VQIQVLEALRQREALVAEDLQGKESYTPERIPSIKLKSAVTSS